MRYASFVASAVVAIAVLCASRFVVAEPTPACKPDERFDGPPSKAPEGRLDYRHLIGRPMREVHSQYGEPDCRSKDLWRYWFPRGCRYDKIVLTVTFRDGKVAGVSAVKIVTGEECR